MSRRRKDTSKVAPVGGHDDDAIVLLHLSQQQVDMMAAMLLPVLKDSFALIKEQQCIMNLSLPAGTPSAARSIVCVQEKKRSVQVGYGRLWID